MARMPNRFPTLAWRKSRASDDEDECVEVARLDASILVRDSNDRDGAVLAFTPAQWTALMTSIHNGKFG